LGPRQGDSTSHNGAAHVAFDHVDGLGPCVVTNFVAQPHTPHDGCVRFVPAVAGDHVTLATRRPATALPGPDFHGLDRTSLPWRTDIMVHGRPSMMLGAGPRLTPLVFNTHQFEGRLLFAALTTGARPVTPS